MKTRYFYKAGMGKMYVHSAKAVNGGWDVKIRAYPPDTEIEDEFTTSELAKLFDKEFSPVRYIVSFRLTTQDSPLYIWDAGAATNYRGDAKSYPTRFAAGLASSTLHERYPESLAYVQIEEK
jgi:hypothetical protein